jgi:hypothetical protein
MIQLMRRVLRVRARRAPQSHDCKPAQTTRAQDNEDMTAMAGAALVDDTRESETRGVRRMPDDPGIGDPTLDTGVDPTDSGPDGL